MRTFNAQRAELIFHVLIPEILAAGDSSCTEDSLGEPLLPDRALRPLTAEEVQEMEVFVRPYRSVVRGPPLEVNPPVQSGYLLLTPISALRCSRHVLAVRPAGGRGPARPAAVALWLQAQADPKEAVRGFFHACLFRELLGRVRWEEAGVDVSDAGLRLDPGVDLRSGAAMQEVLLQTYARSAALQEVWWDEVAAALGRQGWRFDVSFLDAKEQRISVELPAS